jgi:hypothetical protein
VDAYHSSFRYSARKPTESSSKRNHFEKEAAAEQPATPEFLEEFNKQGIWKVRLEHIRRATVLTYTARSKIHRAMTKLF